MNNIHGIKIFDSTGTNRQLSKYQRRIINRMFNKNGIIQCLFRKRKNVFKIHIYSKNLNVLYDIMLDMPVQGQPVSSMVLNDTYWITINFSDIENAYKERTGKQ